MNGSVAIGCDHGGFAIKRHLGEWLGAKGFEVRDVGCYSDESTDYPDYARLVAEAVAGGEVEAGILICTTGIGMSIAANKVPGVRAGLACDAERAELTRRHNGANVLCMGGGYVDEKEAENIALAFLESDFEGNDAGKERHRRRVGKIKDIEEKYK